MRRQSLNLQECSRSCGVAGEACDQSELDSSCSILIGCTRRSRAQRGRRIDHDATANQFGHVDAMIGVVEGELHAVMGQRDGVHALGEAGLVEKINGVLFQQARAPARAASYPASRPLAIFIRRVAS